MCSLIVIIVLRLFLCSVCRLIGLGWVIVFMVCFVCVGYVVVVIVYVWWLGCGVVGLVVSCLLVFGWLGCLGCSWRCVVV